MLVALPGFNCPMPSVPVYAMHSVTDRVHLSVTVSEIGNAPPSSPDSVPRCR